jgi:hypothetical protein
LTFSTNKTRFPRAIARRIAEGSDEWAPGRQLSSIIRRSGFSVNAAKTRMQYDQSRQDVTGLVVNSKVNVRREYERTARAMAHRLFKTGAFQIRNHEPDPTTGEMVPKDNPGTLNQLHGVFSFIDNVKRSNWGVSNPRPAKRVGYECTYRDFLFYKEFYAGDAPLILCEGKTDNIYLKCAIRSLAASVPVLAHKNGKTTSFKVKFKAYTETTARMLDLSGGTGELNKFISNYNKEWARFTLGHKKQPLIIVIDNDQGSDGIYKAVSSVTKKPVDRKADFIHVRHNLYIVPTPLSTQGADTMIEDFFAPAVLQTKLNGKIFNPSKKFDSATEYSKYLFAEQVVRKQQGNIDFKNFLPILQRIEKAIADYAAKP